MEKPLRGPALNEAIRNYIKQYILEHKLNGGDALPPETQLAQDLGVGRSSVREAIKALQSLGIVEVRHGNGLYVREYNFDPILETFSYGLRFNAAMLAELTQIRIWLEAAAIEEAVKRISEEEIAQLENLMETWSQRAESNDLCPDLDEQFHRNLYQILDNQTLIKLLEVFWVAFENLDIEAIRDADPMTGLEQHQAILEGVKARDASLTRQRLVQHFSSLQERIDRAIQMDA